MGYTHLHEMTETLLCNKSKMQYHKSKEHICSWMYIFANV